MKVRDLLSQSTLQRLSGKLAICLLVSSLAACGGPGVTTYPSQHWKGINVHVQASKGGVPGEVMDEIMVMASDNRGRPVHDLLVSVRDSDKDVWGQAIQDGEIGVYRKAIKMEKGRQARIQVRIVQEKDNTQTILFFPPKP